MRNLHDFPVKGRGRPTPYSETLQFTVELLSQTAPPDENDPEASAACRWRFDLAPGASGRSASPTA